MKQTKKQSLLESATNTAVGFVISLIATFIIFPLVGFESSFSKNLIVTAFFTVVSLATGYFIRRFFNKKTVQKVN
jgi:predicted membrane protein